MQWKYSGTLLFVMDDNKAEDICFYESAKTNVLQLILELQHIFAEINVNINCVLKRSMCFVTDKGRSLKSSKKPCGEVTANKTSEF